MGHRVFLARFAVAGESLESFWFCSYVFAGVVFMPRGAGRPLSFLEQKTGGAEFGFKIIFVAAEPSRQSWETPLARLEHKRLPFVCFRFGVAKTFCVARSSEVRSGVPFVEYTARLIGGAS